MSEGDRISISDFFDEVRKIVREELRAHRQPEGDRQLDIEEAAKILSVSEDWLYHNRKKLPFARKIGPKMIRFSYSAMMRWLESKKFS